MRGAWEHGSMGSARGAREQEECEEEWVNVCIINKENIRTC